MSDAMSLYYHAEFGEGGPSDCTGAAGSGTGLLLVHCRAWWPNVCDSLMCCKLARESGAHEDR